MLYTSVVDYTILIRGFQYKCPLFDLTLFITIYELALVSVWRKAQYTILFCAQCVLQNPQ